MRNSKTNEMSINKSANGLNLSEYFKTITHCEKRAENQKAKMKMRQLKADKKISKRVYLQNRSIKRNTNKKNRNLTSNMKNIEDNYDSKITVLNGGNYKKVNSKNGGDNAKEKISYYREKKPSSKSA